METSSRRKALLVLNRDDVQEYIKEIAGEEGFFVFSYLLKKKNEIDEFTLSENLDIQVNRLRSILYKLYNKGLVKFSKRRDKKKGWFIFSWSANPSQLLYLMRKKYEERIGYYEKLLSGDYYFCENNLDKAYTLEEAAQTMFLCPVCGAPLKSSRQFKDEIEKRVSELKKKLKVFEIKKKKVEAKKNTKKRTTKKKTTKKKKARKKK